MRKHYGQSVMVFSSFALCWVKARGRACASGSEGLRSGIPRGWDGVGGSISQRALPLFWLLQLVPLCILNRRTQTNIYCGSKPGQAQMELSGLQPGAAHPPLWLRYADTHVTDTQTSSRLMLTYKRHAYKESYATCTQDNSQVTPSSPTLMQENLSQWLKKTPSYMFACFF